MRRFLEHLTMAAAAALLGGVAPAATSAEAQPRAPAPASAPASAPALGVWVDTVFATGAVPGMAAAVVRGDSVILLAALGVADVETGRPVEDGTRFYVASTTKSFTALAAVLLDRRGVVRLDAPLAELLPGVALHEGLDPRTITLRDLLAMRSGIDDGPVVVRTAYTGEFDTPLLLRLIARHPPTEGGRGTFRYGNTGYNVAGLALERATGRDWKRLVAETVFEPLGMRETEARISSVRRDRLALPHEWSGGALRRLPLLKTDRTMHAAGGHVSTARDLARWLVAQLGGGRVAGARGVPAEAIAETQRPHVAQDRDFSFVHRIGWGLGWDVAEYRGDTLLQRNGSFPGYYSHVSFMPGRRVGVVVLANGGLAGSAAEAVAQGLYDLLLGRAQPRTLDSLRAGLADRVTRARAARDTAAPRALPHPIARYLGRYVNDDLGTLVLERRGDTLVARMGDSWGVAQPVAGRPDALEVEILGDDRTLDLRFEDGARRRVAAVAMREFVFRRVD